MGDVGAPFGVRLFELREASATRGQFFLVGFLDRQVTLALLAELISH